MRHLIAITLTAIAVAGCASASNLGNREVGENDVYLNGPITRAMAKQSHPLDETSAAVCGMKHRSSTLSVRTAPMVNAKEIYRARYYSIVDFTGKISSDGKWVEIESVSHRVDTNGFFLEIVDQTKTEVTGWVSLRYLCDFEM
ncbi:hypothetical protein BDE40_1873 [Litoreibacter halocynthiae]|uniref:SH3 domain-containing protein n=1 Tax=Litoreibacter halocynthiae TaxID=1242689 RepID=A0A4R7LHA6_9RHOB|nr:hypothetical protein [Litoreibacter halocynthiae]TDT75147.1 hypothetical protein BDE40_1873 [Litoreibacter halocynthiae]